MNILLLFSCILIILEKPWMLYGIIIALSSGYAVALIGGIIYGFIKCIQYTHDKVLQFRNKRREEAEPRPMQLRQMQQNLQYQQEQQV